VDEKPSIQALQRSQGYLKLPNGRAMIGQSHDYKRNAPPLFAALNVGTGAVTGLHHKRRRRVEFLAFIYRVVAQDAGQDIHVILNNLPIHKPKWDMSLRPHANVPFHYTRRMARGSRAHHQARPSPYVPIPAQREQVHLKPGELSPPAYLRQGPFRYNRTSFIGGSACQATAFHKTLECYGRRQR
jgi:hypothetical protein